MRPGGGFAALTRNRLILRSKVTFFQKFFIPASMLAGFLGLLLGSQFLNVIHFSDAMSSYAGLLVILVFAIIGLTFATIGILAAMVHTVLE